MKNLLKFLIPLPGIVAVIIAANLSTGCAGGKITPTASADIQNALLTVSNVLQQLNTGIQTAAPSIDAILTLTHNQGDAAAVNNVVAQSAAATPALAALLANVNTAIKSATSPAAQVAAVNAATSPTAISAIVAPIQAAESISPTAASYQRPTLVPESILSMSPGEYASR